MSKLIIPFELDELNIFINLNEPLLSRFKTVGVNHHIITNTTLWVDALLPIYEYMYPDSKSAVAKVQDVVDTLTGIWQLTTLATIGEPYMGRLFDKHIREEDNGDMLVLARRIKNIISKDINGYDEEVVKNSASHLLGIRNNYYYITIPNPGVDFNFINSDYYIATRPLYLGLELIYSELIKGVINGLKKPCDDTVNVMLEKYLETDERFDTIPYYASQLLLERMRDALNITLESVKQERKKSTKLRILK